MSEVKEINTLTTPINITDHAIKELETIRNKENIPMNYGLRVGVKGGGCSGFTYILGFDDKKDGDQEFQIKGMTVYLQNAHALYLLGMEIDFVIGLNNRGFSFNNPNATDTCGCGTSFDA